MNAEKAEAICLYSEVYMGFHFSLSFCCLSTLKGLLYDVICPGDPPTKDKQHRCAIVHPPDIISVLIS